MPDQDHLGEPFSTHTVPTHCHLGPTCPYEWLPEDEDVSRNLTVGPEHHFLGVLLFILQNPMWRQLLQTPRMFQGTSPAITTHLLDYFCGWGSISSLVAPAKLDTFFLNNTPHSQERKKTAKTSWEEKEPTEFWKRQAQES